MKLEKIMEQEGTRIQKFLVPSNSGLSGMNPNPYQALGIPQSSADRYLDEKLGVEIVQYRGEDVPAQCDYFTEQGIPVFGLTGDDLFDEYKLQNPASQLRLLDTIDWINKPEIKYDGTAKPCLYSRPTLCLISVEGRTLEDFPKNPSIVVNAKYEQTARQYIDTLAEDYGVQFAEVRILNGKLENEIPQLADYGIDIVVSGNTLRNLDKAGTIPRQPPLCVAAEIRQSDMSVITSWPKYTATNAAPECLDVLAQQYATLLERLNAPNGSYSSGLLQNPNKLLGKAGEEFAELIAAFAKGDAKNLIEESQQVIWAVQMMLVKSGVDWENFLTYVGTQQR